MPHQENEKVQDSRLFQDQDEGKNSDIQEKFNHLP